MAGHITDDHNAALSHAEKNEVIMEKSSPISSEHAADIDEDSVHAGLEFPTHEELHTLRRVSDKVPWKAYLIALIEMAERFSYYGCTVVYTNFIQQPLPPGSRTGAATGDLDQAGALGRGQQASTGLTTFNQFWVYVTPLVGAYIADTYWGRYKTISYAVAVIIFGHIILIISAVPGVIEKESAIGAFVVAIIIIGIGTGGFKSNISPLIAEQYKRTKLFIRTEKSGERVIVDPSMTISRVYMYFYLFTNIGALVGQIAMTYAEKYVGFWLAFTLPTVVFMLAPFVLYFGRNRYERAPPTGSVLSVALRIFRHSSRGRWSLNPIRTWKNFNQGDFWESAKPSKQTGEIPAWMTYDDVWVDEVARGFKACAVFLWYPLWWLTYNQINNNLTSQAATMETNGIPNDILSNLDPFALIILIPILDILIYPLLRRLGIRFSALRRIVAGFFAGALAMMVAAIVQHYIYKTSPCGYDAGTCKAGNSPLNVWIQTPAYILIALSEIFASITGLEYAFTKAPKNMRSLVMSIFLFMTALASAIGEAFIPLVEDPLLVWNYGVVGVLSFFGAIGCWWMTRDLDKKEDELNMIGAGHVDANVKH